MSGHRKPTPPHYSKRTLVTAGMFAWDAVSALTFVTDPARWPAFAAWLEQLGTGDQWTKDDRERMTMAGQYFLEVAQLTDRMRGWPPDAG